MAEIQIAVSGDIETYISCEHDGEPKLIITSWVDPNGARIDLKDLDVDLGGDEDDDTTSAAMRLAATLRALADKYDPKTGR